MKSNETLQKDVQDAIKWEPSLNVAEIGVTAKDGVVTLTGTVDTFRKKREAEEVTKNIAGVKAVVEKIELKFGIYDKKSDGDIARDLVNAYKWNWEVPNDKVKVKVENGWVTLDGEMHWNFQKEAAKKSASLIDGVKGVSNNISIKSESQDAVEKKDIERAFERNWSINDRDVKVKVSRNNVTLNGTVHSLYQKEEVGRIAWNAPGVSSVDNELEIEYN